MVKLGNRLLAVVAVLIFTPLLIGIYIFPNSPVVWSKTFTGDGNDWMYSVVQTTDGGYALAGQTTSYGAGDGDFWLVKTDSDGNEEWSQTFGDAQDEQAASAVQTTDGGYAIVGSVWSPVSDGWDAKLVKTDSEGNEEWSQTFGGSGTLDWANSVIQTSDGGYAFAGFTNSYDVYGVGENDYEDLWLIKTDSEGNEEWNQTFGGASNDQAYSVTQTSDDGYMLLGFTKSSGAGKADIWFVKTDSEGNEEWNQTFGDAKSEEVAAFVQTTDGGYAILGHSLIENGAGGWDFWLAKTDSTFNQEWSKVFGGERNDQVSSVFQASDGGYMLFGSTWSYGAGGWDFWAIKTDSSGNMQWDSTLGGSDGDVLHSAIQTSKDSYVLVGFTNSYDAVGWDSILVKFVLPEGLSIIQLVLICVTIAVALVMGVVKLRECL